jgi:hypothetical protein
VQRIAALHYLQGVAMYWLQAVTMIVLALLLAYAFGPLGPEPEPDLE